MHRKLTAVDLFCGAGGLSKGFINAGIEIIGAFDFWDKAIETHLANLPCPAEILDLSDVENSIKKIKPLKPNIIAGGPPCQDFSVLNAYRMHRVTDDDDMTYKRYLTVKFAEIIVACQPDFFLMENVPPTRNSRAYAMALKIYQDNGYYLTNTILGASYYNTPQKRRRLFCFGALEKNTAPDMFLESITARQAKKPMTIKEHFGDDIQIDNYLMYPRFKREAVRSVHKPSYTVLACDGRVPPSYKGDYRDAVHHKTPGLRHLTTEERGRVQTFPKDWKWLESQKDRDICQQIGNAVPVNLAACIGQAIIDADNKKPKQMLLEL